MIIDTLDNFRQYLAVNPLFSKVADFLEGHDLATMEEGKYELEGTDLFLNVTTAKGKTPDAAVMDGDANVFLLLRGVVEQCLHIVFQKPIVLYDDGNNRNEDADDKRPIQEQEEKLKIEGSIEDDAYRKEIADGDEECQSDNDTGMMPYTPGLYSLRQTANDSPSIESIATRSDKAKDGCRHALIALIGTESEWLQQIEYRPYDYTI